MNRDPHLKLVLEFEVFSIMESGRVEILQNEFDGAIDNASVNPTYSISIESEIKKTRPLTDSEILPILKRLNSIRVSPFPSLSVILDGCHYKMSISTLQSSTVFEWDAPDSYGWQGLQTVADTILDLAENHFGSEWANIYSPIEKEDPDFIQD